MINNYVINTDFIVFWSRTMYPKGNKNQFLKHSDTDIDDFG